MTEKIKLSKEQLKAKRIENLERARLLKKSGRPKGSKNKITEKKIILMLERLLEDKKTLTLKTNKLVRILCLPIRLLTFIYDKQHKNKIYNLFPERMSVVFRKETRSEPKRKAHLYKG